MDEWSEFRKRWKNREVTMEDVIDQLVYHFHDREMWGRVEQANIEVVRRKQAVLAVSIDAMERRCDALRQQHKTLTEQYALLTRQYEAMLKRVVALESRLSSGADQTGTG